MTLGEHTETFRKATYIRLRSFTCGPYSGRDGDSHPPDSSQAPPAVPSRIATVASTHRYSDARLMRQKRHSPIHPWSTTTVVDQAAIDHERLFGCIVLADNDNVLIRAAQRVDFDLLANPVTARVSNPRITLGSYYELTGPQARRAGGFLIEAANFVDRIASQDGQTSVVRAVFGP